MIRKPDRVGVAASGHVEMARQAGVGRAGFIRGRRGNASAVGSRRKLPDRDASAAA